MADPPFAAAAVRACEILLGERPSRVDHPGGKRRRAVRLHLEGRTIIAAYRKRLERAKLEAAVLRELGERGARVPRVLGARERWILQEDVGAKRLSEALDESDAPGRERLLGTALASLARLHEAGSDARLDRLVAPLERSPKWLRGLISMPGRIGRHLGIPAPALPVESIRQCLRARAPRFIKWDARPGNASVGDDGEIAWFDWEHCTCRNRLDDVAWLLGDEYTADDPQAEARLLDDHIGRFADDLSRRQAVEYLQTFGVFHSCVRLSLILATKGTGEWWDWDYCLSGDKVGVTEEAALRLCARGGRWAGESERLASLQPWFDDIAARISGAR